jgi:lipopolysaccharide biosynthesis glycosyltransferase
MNIVYATSDMYSKPALVSIKSLLSNNENADEINIYYVENGLTLESKNKLIRLVNQYSRNITFIPMPPELNNVNGLLRTNSIVYSYCYFQDILPQNVELVLLLESDAIVTADLHEYFDLDIEQYYLAASDDFQSKWYKKKLGMRSDSVYFNSGIMLFNLKKWRTNNISEKITRIVQSKKSKFFYEVQDELNILLENKILVLPPRFNCTTSIMLFEYKDMLKYRQPSTICTKEEFIEARKNPIIVHFTKNVIIQSRPWIKGCEHPYNDYYISMRNDTELKNEPLWNESRGWISKVTHAVYNSKLKSILVPGLGLIHAVLYPTFFYRFSK